MLGFTGILGLGGTVAKKKEPASESWSSDGIDIAKLHAEQERIMAEQKRMMSMYGMKVTPTELKAWPTAPSVTVRPYSSTSPLQWEDISTPPPVPMPIPAPPMLSPADMLRYSEMMAKKLEQESILKGIALRKPSGKSDESPKGYGTRIFPEGMRVVLKDLADQPSALRLINAMMSCVGYGCVIKATRAKLMEVSGLSASSYTRGMNVLLGLGFVYPNLKSENIQPGFVQPADLAPKSHRKNGQRYKIAPFIAFRGSSEMNRLENKRYQDYMGNRATARLTPVERDDDDSTEFVAS